MDMIFYWVRDRLLHNYFHIFWEEVRKNLADHFIKHHPLWQHITIQKILLKRTRKYTENSKERQTITI